MADNEFGFQPEDTGNEFGFKPELEAPKEQPAPQISPSDQKAKEFEEMPILERAAKAPTGAIESYGRGAINIVGGTLAQGFGSLAGLASGKNLEESISAGQKAAEAIHIPAFQKSSAYFDEQTAKGLEFARNWIGEHATKSKPLDQATLKSLKDEAANRGIAEGVFDNVIVPAIMGKMIPRGKKAAELPPQEEGIKPGPTGPQGEFGFEETSNIPPTMEGQPNRSPYNLPPEEVDRLSQELNPPTERRVNDQGELFTDYNPVERFSLSQEAGGRNRDIAGREDVFEGAKVTDEMQPPHIRPEQLGPEERANEPAMEPNQYDEPRGSARITPDKPLGQTLKGRKQGGAIDPDLLAFGVRRLLDSRGFKTVMEKFRGTFSDVAIDHALRQSEDPKSRETIVFMTPDRFHELAMKRRAFDPSGMEVPLDKRHAELLRSDIRSGIEGKSGLNQIPELVLDKEDSFSPGAAVHRVVAHEGRHRADVFKEKGLDLMPVRVTHSTMRWGEAHAEDFPRRVISENGKFIDFPQPENWKGVENDLDFTKIFKSQQGMIDFGIFKKNSDKEVSKKGFVPALLDARKQFQMERRDLPTLMKEEGINVNTIKDIGDAFAAGTKALTDRTVSILSETNKDIGKMLKWAVDQVSEIARKSDLDTEKDLYGEKYKGGSGSITRPFENRVRSEEGILTLWKDAHKSSEGKVELRSMLSKAVDNIGKDLTRGDFVSDKQHKIYQAVQRGLSSVLDRVNKARGRAGLKPIDRLPGFLPASWEGDYRVHVFDGLGNKKMSFGFSNVYQAKLATKALKENHPDLTIKDPVHVDIDKTQIGDLSAFEETIRALGKDDPTSLALQKTMVQLRSTKGFGRHGLQRKGVMGFLGMEEGDTGVRNMERSLEQYVRQANRYISNIEKAQVASQLDNLPLKIQQQIPNGLQYMRDYIDQSRGADLDRLPFVKDFFSGLSKLGGFGASAPMKVLRELSSLSSMWFLTTPRFVLSQVAQHTNAIAKYVQLYHEGNFKNPVIAYWKGLENLIKPDAQAIEGANWAQRNGSLDSALVAMLEMKLSDVSFERTRIVKDGISVFMGQLEKKFVRLPTFLAFEYGLRDSIKDSNLRYETAANMMDHYMVHYSKTARPLMYSKMGMVGEAASQFKQYSHNGFGQFFEYLQYAQKEGGSIAPLATHIGMQIAIGGLKGTILVSEASAAIAAINYVLQKSGSETQIPDLQDLLMNSNLHDMLVFGGLSTVLNSDISSSVNAPNVPQMISAPQIQFTAKAAQDSANYLMKKLAGEDTEADQMRAFLSVAPSAMRGWIEELYSKPGLPVPKPGQGMKGDYVRNEDEKMKAKIFSFKSLNEARINALANATRKELAKDANSKISELDAIVDHVQSGKSVDPAVMQRYIKNGGDVNHLSDTIVNRIRERSMDFANREVYNKNLTPAQIHKLDVMKNLLNEEYRQKQQSSEYQKQSAEVDEEKPQVGVSHQSEIQRRQALINQYMGKEAEKRYNPVINEMTDKEKEQFYYQKEQQRMREQRKRKIEM